MHMRQKEDTSVMDHDKEEAVMREDEHKDEPVWTKMSTSRRQRRVMITTRRETGQVMSMRRSP